MYIIWVQVLAFLGLIILTEICVEQRKLCVVRGMILRNQCMKYVLMRALNNGRIQRCLLKSIRSGVG